MRIGLVGVSHWHAAIHLDALRFAAAELVGVWDPSQEIAQRFAAAAGCTPFESLAALIRNRPDLVVVMGRPDQMPSFASEILDAHLAMMIEKPIASSARGFQSLVERVRREGAFVAVPLPNRLSPIWQELESLRAADRLGPISHAQFRIVNGPPSRYRALGVDWVLDPVVGGGGALRNLGIHGIDAALTLANGEPLAIADVTLRKSLYGEAVEEYALVRLEAASGMIVTVEAGYTFASTAAGGDFEWRVSARNAYAIDRGAESSIVTLDDGLNRRLRPITSAERYRHFMCETFARLRRGAPPLVGIEDCWAAMDLIDKAYERARA